MKNEEGDKKKRIRSLFLFLVLCLITVFSLKGIRFAYYPRSDKNILSVSIVLNGAGQDQIETLITDPLEEELLLMTEVRIMSSRSDDGRAHLTLLLNDDADPDQSYLELRDILDRAVFPPQTQKPVISRNDRSDFPVFILMFEDFHSEERIKAGLNRIKGVGRIDVSSAPRKDLIIEAGESRLNSLGLSPSDLAGILNRNNSMGSLRFLGEKRIVIDRRFNSPEEFGESRIKGGLNLSGISRITVQNSQVRSISMVKGEKKVIAWVRESGDANSIELCRRLREASDEFGTTRVLYDKGLLITKALEEVFVILLISISAVVLMTALFIRDWKATLLLGLNLPFSLAATLALFQVFGWEADILVLAGLALSTGMIIDSGVIYLESGFHLSGKPIFFSLCSTVLVFSSFLFAPHSVKVQNSGLIRSLCVSQSLSVFYILVLMHGILQQKKPSQQDHGKSDLFWDRCMGNLGKRKSPVLIGLVLLTCLSLMILKDLSITKDFQLEDSTLRFSLEYPAGTRIEAVEQSLAGFENEILNWNEAEYYTSEYKAEKASYYIKLKDIKDSERLKSRIRGALEGHPAFIYFPEDFRSDSYQIRLVGYNRQKLYQSATALAAFLPEKIPCESVILHYKEQPDILSLHPDRDALHASGITSRMIHQTLTAQLGRPVMGKWIPPVRTGENQNIFDIRIFDPEYIEVDAYRLSRLSFPNYSGVSLSELADFTDRTNYGGIEHFNTLRTLSFSLTGLRPDTPTVYTLVEEALEDYPLQEVRVIHGQDLADRIEYKKGLTISLMLSLVLLFLLLVFLFESLFLPVYLFLQIILSHLFSLALLTLLNFPLSAPVFFALVLNTGLLVNNGLILFGRFTGGPPKKHEVIRSLKSCSFTILTATATTLCGLLPLLFNGSGGMLPALSLTVSSGLIFSILIQILTIPVVFRR